MIDENFVISLPEPGLNLFDVITHLENQLIDQALLRTQGNRTWAAEMLGLNRPTLVEKLRKRGMVDPSNRGDRTHWRYKKKDPHVLF